MAASLRPRKTLDTLEKVLNTFAVRNPEGSFDYYTITLSKEPRGTNGKFVDILKMPPVISEGYAYYKRNVYFVSLRDFLRRYINVSNQPINLVSFNQQPNTPPVLEISSNVEDKSRPLEDAELIDHEVINLAWEEQIAALHYLEDS